VKIAGTSISASFEALLRKTPQDEDFFFDALKKIASS